MHQIMMSRQDDAVRAEAHLVPKWGTEDPCCDSIDIQQGSKQGFQVSSYLNDLMRKFYGHKS